MAISLHVLLIEDSESDAELALLHIKKTGYAVSSLRVKTNESMIAVLG